MRTRSEADPTPLTGLINEAVDRGIIDGTQRDKLHALALELAAASTANAGEALPTATHEPRREARRGFNAITIAYALGSLLVLFALGWFLADRWRSLGPAGVLGVSL